MKHTIFFICPSARDRFELSHLARKDEYDVIFHEYDTQSFEQVLARGVVGDFESSNPARVIDDLSITAKKYNVTGVASTDDYPGSIYASIIAHYNGLRGPRPAALLQCQHKYNSRVVQKRYVPEVTPHFTLFDTLEDVEQSLLDAMVYPVFVKPVKSYYSVGANKASNAAQLKEMLTQAMLPRQFLSHFDWFLKTFGGSEIDSCAVLVESFLSGIQVTLEGYCFQGEVSVVGIVDSIMFPGTICFERFEYPSSLPADVQERMAAAAKTIVKAMHLTNCMFNIEFMYDPQTNVIGIIEINPRMAAQFADLYEKVDGFNTYQVLLDIATGKKPVTTLRHGKHAIAASCILRTFENQRVVAVPTQNNIDNFFAHFSDGRYYPDVVPGMALSDILQDGKSYRYGLIHLGAHDKQDLLKKFESAKEFLPFHFASL
ncbi:hypothetical protein Noda2021_07630 [Candidatus Dependentiae bacterium Noda2021]|nr:hypothetical protein Noda2021_07630 [Candidatus Dependentiae bacterium Noda2021]